MISFLWRKWIRNTVRNPRTILRLEHVEDRLAPAGLAAVGSQPGTPALVTVYDVETKTQQYTLSPFPGFTGGVNVALGDVNGDGTVDIIVGAGAGGGPIVNVYDGTNGTFLKTFVAGDPASRAGVSVAAGDIDQDGRADIITGSMNAGQPLVQALRFSDLTQIRGFTPFSGAASVAVASGDVNGDGTPDLIAGSGAGVASAVVAYSGADGSILRSFNPFESTFLGGVYVAAGDVNGDGKADIIVAASTLGGPRVSVYSGLNGTVTANFFAYDSNLRDGTFAVAYNANGTGNLDLATTNGPNNPPDPKAFDAATTAQITATLLPGLPITTAYDTKAPTATLSTTATNPTAGNPIPFTATFSEAVNGFTAAGLTVTNGTAGAVTRVNAKTYTFSVTPTADGAVSVTVAANSAFDAAGNKNTASTASSVTFDGTPPTVGMNNVTTNDTTPTLTGAVGESTATVSVSVGGQTIPATVSGTTWSATVPVALAEGTYTVTVTATDTLGNAGTATASLAIDTTAPVPTVTSTAGPTTSTTPIPFRIDFGEAVTGFVAGDITVVNGSIANFIAVSASVYDITVTPTAEGVVTVSVAAGRANDIAGNANTASDPLSVNFDTGDISLTVNPLTTNDSTPTLTGTVSDSTATVTVTVNGQTVTAVVTGNAWSATLTTPLADGIYDIEVHATDAMSNTGTVTGANGLSIDTVVPSVELSSGAGAATNASPIAFNVLFSEAVAGFTESKVSAINGTVSAFTGAGASYTFQVTPNGQGAVIVSLPAGAGHDPAGNTSTASNTLTIVYDTVAPHATVDPLTTNLTMPTLTGTVDEPGVAVSVTVDGQTFAAVVTGQTWSATVPTPLGEGTYDVAVTATDAAGNVGSTPGTGSLVIDTTAPVVSSITATPNTGTHGEGDHIDITVTLSEVATLSGGTFQLLLDTGATVDLTQDTNDPARYVGTYTVRAGDSSPQLNSVSLSLLGGATLVDAAGNDANLSISLAASLAENAALVIDTSI